MKQLIIVLFTLFAGISLHAQSDADRIEGVWLNNTQNAKIEIYESDAKYFGKIVWLAKPYKEDGTPHTDIKNPDPELRGREIMGMEVISDLEYDDGEWVDGTIYSAKKGQVVDCTAEVSEDNTELHVTVSKGLFFSRTVVWTKADK
jgi:uncharacterized protein (DUF2147 family)